MFLSAYKGIHVDVNDGLCQVSGGFDLDKLSSAVVCIGDVQVGQHPLAAFVYWQSSTARLSTISQVTSHNPPSAETR
jgi:hypothetical protein